jgi:hypothetical protein
MARRFWEHDVQNEDDFIRCCDYIHYNPVKMDCAVVRKNGSFLASIGLWHRGFMLQIREEIDSPIHVG